MIREDLVLEIVRLYNYKRTGLNIKSRINDALGILVDGDGTELKGFGKWIRFVDAEVDRRLLDKIYHKPS